MGTYRTFRVRLEVPDEATLADVTTYIDDAVSSWRGQLRPPCSYSECDPGDPLWHLDPNTITVQTYRPPRNRRGPANAK